MCSVYLHCHCWCHTQFLKFSTKEKSAYFNEKNETDTADRNLRPVYEYGIKLCGKKTIKAKLRAK